MIPVYRLHPTTELTPFMIEKYLEKNHAEESRREKLYAYYKGKQDIQKRTLNDPSKPNNKIVNPYAHYITDTMTGYFMGEPIAYRSVNRELLDKVKQINNYNDESAENTELAKDASICGEAYELLYIDEDGECRFKRLEPTKCIPIYDNTIEEELLYFIRFYTDTDIMNGNTITYIEVYSRTDFRLYRKEIGAMGLIEQRPHSFGEVPIVVYKNNEEQIGDFELVISLIDAYDKVVSDNLNDLEYFVDAYLCLYGMMGTEAEDISQMKENRVILMDGDAKAEWLTKSINDGYIENLKVRLNEDIHKFSCCPSLTDKDFASNASGVAMKYKLMGLENSTAKKEASFKKGIQRRLELLCRLFSLMGTDFDYREIEVVFTRNIPVNMTEVADVLNKVGHLLSEQTQISLLPMDIDYEAEKLRKQEEAEQGYDLLGRESQSE